GERNAHADADRADRQHLDGSLHANRAMRAETFAGGETDHLWAIKGEVAWVALAGIDRELRDLLAKQAADRFAAHIVRDVERVNVNSPPAIIRLAHGLD